MHMSEWVGYLPVVLMPCCSCQRSEPLLMVILLPPLLSVDGFLAFGGVCDWRSVAVVELLDLMMLLLWSSWIWCCYCCGAPGSDVAAAMELPDYHSAMFGVSLRISWSCCWLVLWGCCNKWTEGVGVYVDAGMTVMVEVILLENTISPELKQWSEKQWVWWRDSW